MCSGVKVDSSTLGPAAACDCSLPSLLLPLDAAGLLLLDAAAASSA